MQKKIELGLGPNRQNQTEINCLKLIWFDRFSLGLLSKSNRTKSLYCNLFDRDFEMKQIQSEPCPPLILINYHT